MQIGTVPRLWLCRRSWRLKLDFGRNPVYLWQSHVCRPSVGCTTSKLSHSSTDSEVISLGAGLRMDGIPALDLWDVVIEVLHSSPNQVLGDQEHARRNLQRNKPQSRFQFNTTILSWPLSIMFPQTRNLIVLAPCFTFLKIMKRWSRWSSMAEIQQ